MGYKPLRPSLRTTSANKPHPHDRVGMTYPESMPTSLHIHTAHSDTLIFLVLLQFQTRLRFACHAVTVDTSIPE